MTHDWFSHLEEGQNAPGAMEMGCRTRREGEVDRELTPAEVAALGCRPGDRIDPLIAADTTPPATFQQGGRSYMSRAHRTTRNTNTAWWDASQIYGYSERSAQRVKRDPNYRAKLLMVLVSGHGGAGETQGYLPLLAASDPMHPAWTGQEAAAFPDNWSIGMSFYHNVFAREHSRLAHVFVSSEHAFDFAQLDSEATDLDLVVEATEKRQVAVGEPADQVSRPVHA